MNSLQPSAFNLAPSPTLQWQPVRNSNFLAIANNAYPCNTTSAAFTVTLPASPAAGNVITLTDYAGTWGTNNLTINPNGLKINGGTTNAIVATNRGSVQLVYLDSTQGWIAYSGFAVTTLPQSVPMEYLVVAGGASGGHSSLGGGGGAGGFRKGSYSALPGQVFTATVGDGGPSRTTTGSGSSGVNSSLAGTLGFTTITSSGGGAGGGENGTAATGGSGGGGRGVGSQSGAAGNSGGYTPAEGNAGGNGNGSFGGGGGGAGGAGANGSGTGNGGVGSEWPTGSGTYYAGGGSNTAGSGGLGGGGGPSTAGGINTGGGGGAWNGTGPGSGAGGKGVVIIRYPDTYPVPSATTGSPTSTTTGGYRYYTFTGNGTLTF